MRGIANHPDRLRINRATGMLFRGAIGHAGHIIATGVLIAEATETEVIPESKVGEFLAGPLADVSSE
jgi:hypothetical protein